MISLNDAEWLIRLPEAPDRSFFHLPVWMNCVTESFGGEKVLLAYKDKWLMNCFMGNPWSKGFRIGSIGYGGPLPLKEDGGDFQEAVSAASEYLDKPFTGLTLYPSLKWEKAASSTEIIPLKGSKDEVFQNTLSGNVRTAIRRCDAECRELKPGEAEKAHLLLNETQKLVGASYQTPLKFFLDLTQLEGVSVWGAFYNDEMLASSLLLTYGQKAFHLFHGWAKDKGRPGMNQALIWAMIQKSLSERCISFNLGESHSTTLREAKKRWGSVEYPLPRIP
jgi:hypothetical protein